MTSSPRHEQMNNIGHLRVGRHYSPGGKLALATLAQVLEEPASAMQLFAGNPRRYWGSKTTDADRAAFVEASSHLYKTVHCCYITNIGDHPDTRSYKMSTHCLVNQLEWAERHGCQSMVFHPGSPLDHNKDDSIEWATAACREALISYQGPVHLLLENAAHPKKIGGSDQDLRQICDAIDDDRLGVCIDTTHAFAAGYTTPQIQQFPELFGDKLRLIHFNTPDQGVKLGSKLDRHSSSFADGVFTRREIQDLYVALREYPLILEGTPDLAADVCWFLRWELQMKEGDLVPETEPNSLGELFELGDPDRLVPES